MPTQNILMLSVQRYDRQLATERISHLASIGFAGREGYFCQLGACHGASITHVSRLKHPGALAFFIDLVPIAQTDEGPPGYILISDGQLCTM
jgi:hypothetical protein